MQWSLGGWLLTPFLQNRPERAQGLRQRVADEIKTTFASSYTEKFHCPSAAGGCLANLCSAGRGKSFNQSNL